MKGLAVFVCGALLAGCATQPLQAPPAAARADARECAPSQGPLPRPDLCRYPPDVQAFVIDRDVCDHFRGEPWPESDSGADRERRRQIVDGVRTACAGTDRQLEALLARYADDAGVMRLLSEFERGIESDPP